MTKQTPDNPKCKNCGKTKEKHYTFRLNCVKSAFLYTPRGTMITVFEREKPNREIKR